MTARGGNAARCSCVLVLGCLACVPPFARAAPALRQDIVVEGIDSPTAMATAPDGRVFVCEQGGRVRIVKHGRLLPRPFVTVPVVAVREQGLVGITFGRTRSEVFLYLTAPEPAPHARVMRFDAGHDTARAGAVILDLDEDLHPVHVGGALAVGPDGRLYIGTGDNDEGSRSQSLRTTSGKVLRIGRDGRFPDDDPFVDLTAGPCRAIWARGFRNVFAMAFEPRTGRLFACDVGGDRFEEVDVVEPGVNYGWPMFEGPGTFEALRFPLLAYDHAHGCAIVGAAFHPGGAWGSAWRGRFLFADFCTGAIHWIDPRAPRTTHTLAVSRVSGPVALATEPSGDVLVLARGSIDPTGAPHATHGALVRLRRTTQAKAH